MALAVRPTQDIILRESIPLAATSDMPIAETPKPPANASNDVDDQAGGTPKEISPEQLAVAVAARRGDPKTAEVTDNTPAPEDDGIDEIPNTAPKWAIVEVAKIRKQAREARAAFEAAAKAQVGDEAWDKAVLATRDKLVLEARDAAGKAASDAAKARQEAEARATELAELKSRLEALDTPKPVEDPRPARDEFDDPETYDQALIDWNTRQIQRDLESKEAAKKADEARIANEERLAAEIKAAETQQEAIHAEQAAVIGDWEAQVVEIEKIYPDFKEATMKSPEEGGPEITGIMADALMRSGNGAQVAYYLSQDTEESSRIAKLPHPIQQIGEIFRLSERLKTQPRRRTEAPIEPVDTGRRDGPAQVDPDNEDMSAYYQRRNAQLSASRRPFFPPGGIH